MSETYGVVLDESAAKGKKKTLNRQFESLMEKMERQTLDFFHNSDETRHSFNPMPGSSIEHVTPSTGATSKCYSC